MKRFFCIFILILIFFIVASCGGKKEVKKETEDSKIAKEGFALVELIKDAYIKKDISTIQKHTTNDAFKLIVKDIGKFDSVKFTFKPVWVDISSDKVTLNISWEGMWEKGTSKLDERGMAVFILKDRPFKIDKILRSNPFEIPE